jgi:hypothetical protein
MRFKFQPTPLIPITVGGYDLFAEDRRKEREAREQLAREEEERQSRTISNAAPDPTKLLHNAIHSGNMAGPWKDAALIPKMEAEARRKAKREAEEIVPTPEPIFDTEEF